MDLEEGTNSVSLGSHWGNVLENEKERLLKQKLRELYFTIYTHQQQAKHSKIIFIFIPSSENVELS